MDTLGKSKEEREHIRALLVKKYGSQEKAAEQIGISKFTLSRALNGHNLELTTVVDILKSTGHLEQRKYRFPMEDFDTFCHLNGILNFTLK